jgi:hypothetical protein
VELVTHLQCLGRLCPPYEAVNLSIFAIPHPSQIKDLGGVKIAKTGNIHILYGPVEDVAILCTLENGASVTGV